MRDAPIRRWTYAVVMFAVIAAPALATAQRRVGDVVRQVTVAEGRLDRFEAGVRFSSDASLVARRGEPALRLAEAPVAFMGWLGPVSSQSPDDRVIAYNTVVPFRELDPQRSFSDLGINRGDPLRIPVVRVHDLRTGEDRVLEEGAHSAVWSADGALAYVRGIIREQIVGEPYAGHVFVRESLDAAPVQWTTEPDQYIVAGWAGTRLIVYTLGFGEDLTLYVLEGRGPRRLLAQHGSLVAISPDGEQVFVEHSNRSPLVHVLNVADGSEAARYSLREVASAVGERRISLSYAGSWVGNRVVARGSMGLVVFNVQDESIALDRVLKVDRELFPLGVSEPRLVDGGKRIVGRTVAGNPEAGPSTNMILDCETASARCTATATPGRMLHPTHRSAKGEVR